jgi:uncharacterized protein involved in propanediol utilization
MSWKDKVESLSLPNEKEVMKLFKRTPCDPVLYIVKVQDKTGIEVQDYYKILEQKYEEENNKQLLKIVQNYLYLLRDR